MLDLNVKIIEIKIEMTKLNWSLIAMAEANKFFINYCIV